MNTAMTAGPAAKKTTQPGSTLVTTTAVQLLGVGLFALLAGISDEFGSIMVIIMAGIMLGWFLTHTTELQSIVGKL